MYDLKNWMISLAFTSFPPCVQLEVKEKTKVKKPEASSQQTKTNEISGAFFSSKIFFVFFGVAECRSGSGLNLDPGGQKWPTKIKQIEQISFFEVLQVLF